MTGYRKATADQVRTGDTIFTDWSPRGLTLMIDFTTRDLFRRPEGGTVDRIRFTGVDNTGRRVHEGWGVPASGRVYVVEDAPLKADVPGAGVFGALADDEPDVDWDDLEPFDIDGDELL